MSKKLFVSVVIISSIIAFFSSCKENGNKKNTTSSQLEKEIDIENVQIDGLAGRYIEIVPNTYKIKNIGTSDDIKMAISLTFKKVSNPQNQVFVSNSKRGTICFYDQDGFSLKESYDVWIGDIHKELIMLLSSKPGTTANITFVPSKTFKLDSKEEVKEFLQKVSTLSFEENVLSEKYSPDLVAVDTYKPSINDITDDLSNQSTLDVESNDNVASAAEGSNDWDKLLNTYEQYVNSYIKLYKKAMNGDASAMTEYISFMEKATQLSEKLSDADTEMTNAQLQRYMEITNKMTTMAIDAVESTTNPSVKETKVVGGKENWDKLLDSYEKYVDKYIALCKKVSAGNLSAMTEYTEMMSQAQDLSEKLTKAQGEMTSAQWNRYMKILQKMTNAASNL